MPDRVRIQLEGSDYWANGPNFTTILAHVKSLPRARWDAAQKLWVIPGTTADIQDELKRAGINLQLISGPVVSVVPASKTVPPPIQRPRDVIAVACDGKEYWVSGGSFQDMVAAVKNVNGRRWDPARKVWTVPPPLDEAERIIASSGYKLTAATPPEPKNDQEPAPDANAG